MNWQVIEELLEKYYEGETTLREERLLKEWLGRDDVPAHLMAERDQFLYMETQGKMGVLEGQFDDRVLKEISEPPLAKMVSLNRPWIYWISGAAATALIVVAILVQFNPFGKTISDTYTDPSLAYEEAKKVMLFVSSKLNRGTENIKKVEKFDTGMKEMKNLGQFNKGIEKASNVNKIDKVLNIN